MRAPLLLGVFAAAMALAGCATQRPAPLPSPPPQGPITPPKPEPKPAPAPVRPVEIVPLAALPGWEDEDHAAAFTAFVQTCRTARDPAMAAACRSARALGPLDRARARTFFETTFRAAVRPEPGLLTAYFAPVYEARRVPDPEFAAPVRPVPQAVPPEGLPERAEIDLWPTEDALAWMRAEDLFFLQTQGSGVLTFDDGSSLKVLYGSNNGQPFVGIAKVLRERGLLADNNTSGDAIRRWLADHRGPEADEIIRANPRYAFFRLAPNDGLEPAGAAGIPLPPGRGIAIDPAYHRFGELWWIDASAPRLTGAFPIYRRLVTTLDTGGAIKGDIRADLYIGTGDAAGTEAGRVRHTLKIHQLIPNPAP